MCISAYTFASDRSLDSSPANSDVLTVVDGSFQRNESLRDLKEDVQCAHQATQTDMVLRDAQYELLNRDVRDLSRKARSNGLKGLFFAGAAVLAIPVSSVAMPVSVVAMPLSVYASSKFFELHQYDCDSLEQTIQRKERFVAERYRNFKK